MADGGRSVLVASSGAAARELVDVDVQERRDWAIVQKGRWEQSHLRYTTGAPGKTEGPYR